MHEFLNFWFWFYFEYKLKFLIKNLSLFNNIFMFLFTIIFLQQFLYLIGEQTAAPHTIHIFGVFLFYKRCTHLTFPIRLVTSAFTLCLWFCGYQLNLNILLSLQIAFCFFFGLFLRVSWYLWWLGSWWVHTSLPIFVLNHLYHTIIIELNYCLCFSWFRLQPSHSLSKPIGINIIDT